jgi:hypothetical protein
MLPAVVDDPIGITRTASATATERALPEAGTAALTVNASIPTPLPRPTDA